MLLQRHEIKHLHRILKCFLKKSSHSKIEMVNKKGAPKYVNKTHQKAPRFWLSLAGTPRSCTAKFSLHIVCREFAKKKKRKETFFMNLAIPFISAPVMGWNCYHVLNFILGGFHFDFPIIYTSI